MTGYIKHLIHCDSEGDIMMIKPAKGINPEDGSVDANGWTIRHYHYELPDPGGWKDTHWWNGSTWVSRDPRPNKCALWINAEWTWDSEAFLDLVRVERNRRLYLSDWAILPDSPLTEEEVQEVKFYRNHLRNFTATTMPGSGRLEDLVWPIKPNFL
jgi:hypothetical protein